MDGSTHEGGGSLPDMIEDDVYDSLTDLFFGAVEHEVDHKTDHSRDDEGESDAHGPIPFPLAPAGTLVHASSSDASRQTPRKPSPRKTAVELLLLGHLPVLASVWASQYARLRAEQAGGPVGVVRVQAGELTIEVVGGPSVENASSWQEALAIGAGLTHEWIVRADQSLETALLSMPEFTTTTLLTGADKAAVVGAYQSLKHLHTVRTSSDERSIGDVRIAIMGAPAEKAERIGTKIARAAQEFLDTTVRTEVCDAQIGSRGLSVVLFSGPVAESPHEVVGALRSVVPIPARAKAAGDGPPLRPNWMPDVHDVFEPKVTAHSRTPAMASASDAHGSRPKPADSNSDMASAGSRKAGSAAASDIPLVDPMNEPVESPVAHRPAPSGSARSTSQAGHEGNSGEPDLASLSGSYRRLPIACPFAKSVQFALDDDGVVHLLAREATTTNEQPGLEAITVAASWLKSHAELVSMALPHTTSINAETMKRHLFVTDVSRLAHLIGSDIKLHLLGRAQVTDANGFFAVGI